MAVTSAWWVPWSQIQKSDGGAAFEVRGKKNYLPPAMLVLGYGILWISEDEETMERHARPLLSDPTAAEVQDAGGEEEPPTEEMLEEQPEQEGLQEQDDQSESDDESITHEEVKEEDKYNLNEYGSASDDDTTELASTSTALSSQRPPTKHFLSVKERRDLKKGKPISSAPSESTSELDDLSSSISTLSLSSKSNPQQQPTVRGKKGKMKKLKSKYVDQTDEERDLARKLLGAKAQQVEPSPPAVEKVEVKPTVTKKPSPITRPPKPVADEPLEVS